MSTTKKTAVTKGKTNESKEVGLSVNVNVSEMTFDQIMNLDEKELNKQASYNQKLVGKKSQLQAKIIDLTNRKQKVEMSFKLSLIDPTLDSVELKLEMDCMDKEMEIAYGILRQLFPNDYTAPLS